MNLLKRLVAVCLAMSLLVGCGKPSDVSQEMYDSGVEALDVIDQYLADDVDFDELCKEIDMIYKEKPYVSSLEPSEFPGDADVDTAIFYAGITLNSVSGEPSKSELKEIKEDRSRLKKALGR